MEEKRPAPEPAGQTDGDGYVPSGVALEILQTIVAYHQTLTPGQVALAMGKAAAGGYFQRKAGELRSAGLLDGLTITDHGMYALGPGPHPGPLDRDGLIALWAGKLEGLQREMFEAIAAQHPDPLTNDALAGYLGKSAAGGYFQRKLGNLRSRNLIVTRTLAGTGNGNRLHPNFDALHEAAR